MQHTAPATPNGTAVIACRMLQDELTLAMRQTGRTYPVIWLDSRLHETPGRLHAELKSAIASCQDADTLLLAMAFCGNAIDGIGAPDRQLVIPCFQDCIGMLLSEPRHTDAFYLTHGWLVGDQTLLEGYRRAEQRYGEKKARFIYQAMLGNYRAFSMIDTGAYDMEACQDITNQMSSTFQKALSRSRGTTHILHKLLLGHWDEDFLLVRPGETVILQDALVRLWDNEKRRQPGDPAQQADCAPEAIPQGGRP